MNVPTISEINTAIVAQIEASISQTIPFLPKTFTRVLAKVLAAQYVILYKYCGFILLQQFIAHASFREITINGKTFIPLVEWGRLFGVGDPKAATRAQFEVSVQVQNQEGEIKAGTLILRSQSGVLYQVLSEVPLDAANVFVTARAAADQSGGDGSGTIGNLGPDQSLEFVNPLPNVARECFTSHNTDKTITAADAETEAQYRARVLKRVRQRPQGGAYADYESWALETPGIIAVYPYAADTPGEVDVYCEADQASSGSEDGIPTDDQIAAAEALINFDSGGLANRRPILAAVNVKKITRTSINITISALDPDTAALREDLEAAADEYMRTKEPFIEGLSLLPRKDRVIEGELSGVLHGIVAAAGATMSSVKLFVGLDPTPILGLEHGQKAKLGTPSYEP